MSWVLKFTWKFKKIELYLCTNRHSLYIRLLNFIINNIYERIPSTLGRPSTEKYQLYKCLTPTD